MKATWNKEDYHGLTHLVVQAGKHVTDLEEMLLENMHNHNSEIDSLPWYVRLGKKKHSFHKGGVVDCTKEDWKLYHRSLAKSGLLSLLSKIETCINNQSSSIMLSNEDIELVRKYSKVEY